MYIAVLVQFTQSVVQVNEDKGDAEICVMKNFLTLDALELDLAAHNGSARGNFSHT